MLTHELKIRVRYAETDQMSYVYYGNYAQYFEMGRAEWLRNLGYSYDAMEKEGIMLPVINMNVNYLKPARYDNLLTLKTILIKKPTVKIEFNFEIYNEEKELLTTAYTRLIFLNAKTNKPTRCPQHLLDKIKE